LYIEKAGLTIPYLNVDYEWQIGNRFGWSKILV
jgi:hypothetical protein